MGDLTLCPLFELHVLTSTRTQTNQVHVVVDALGARTINLPPRQRSRRNVHEQHQRSGCLTTRRRACRARSSRRERSCPWQCGGSESGRRTAERSHATRQSQRSGTWTCQGSTRESVWRRIIQEAALREAVLLRIRLDPRWNTSHAAPGFSFVLHSHTHAAPAPTPTINLITKLICINRITPHSRTHTRASLCFHQIQLTVFLLPDCIPFP